ncbi:MAG TPA: hypothetical protein PLW05_02895 [Candidatus Marinimicrobia bacterium]|nr:hypothetical protein [Candidatus Neomarinimicrobiota bacterium]
MAITVFIISLFIGIFVLNLLILRYLKGSIHKSSLSVRLPKTVAAFDRYTLKVVALVTLIIIIFMLIAIALQSGFVIPVIQPIALILFIFITGVGFVYFFRSEGNRSKSVQKFSTGETDGEEQK